MFLHNSVAHSHEEESLTIQSCEVDADWCLMEWLESVFQNDFGQDHLEYFNVSSDKTIDLQFDDGKIVLFSSSKLEINYLANHYFRKEIFQKHFPLREYLADNHPQRGPPLI